MLFRRALARLPKPVADALLPGVVLLIGLAITAAGHHFHEETEEQIIKSRFEVRVLGIQSEVHERIEQLDNALKALSAYASALGEPDPKHWQTFVSNFQWDRQFPGLKVVAYLKSLAHRDKAAWVERMRRKTPDFAILPPGDRPEYVVITQFKEYDGRNVSRIGFDLLTDPGRRATMEHARLSGGMIMTDKIPSARDPDTVTKTATVLYRAVYRNDLSPQASAKEKARAVTGYVSLMFAEQALTDFFALRDKNPGFAVRARHIEEGAADVGTPATLHITDAEWQWRHIMKIGGHTWEFEIAFPQAMIEQEFGDQAESLLIVLGGIALSFAFAATVWLLAGTRRRALRLAQDMNASVEETKAFLEAIINAVPSPLFVKDEQHRWILANRAYCEVHGVQPEAVLGRNDHGFLPPKVLERVWREDDEIFASGSAIDDEDLRGPTAEQQRWYLIRRSCFQLPGGRRVIIGLFFDIHQQKQAEQALRASEQELRQHRDQLKHMIGDRTRELVTALIRAEAASRAKSEFLANMSHELRTPMHAILSFAKLGLEKAVDGEPGLTRLPQYLARIETSGQRLLALLNDLLDLSKLEAGKMRYDMNEHDIVATVEETLRELDTLARPKHLRFRVEPPQGTTRAWFDPVRIGQVVRNLIGNAIKFSPDNGEIRIAFAPTLLASGRRAEDPPTLEGIMVTISDDGRGIPVTELERVFDEFVQSSQTKSGAGGTGLGLSICRKIITAHRGRIFAANRPEGGAILSFSVPRIAVSAAAAEIREAA